MLKAMKAFKEKVWLATPTVHEGGLDYVESAYRDNWITTIGENIDQVEKTICKKVGCKDAVALSCGTAALHLAVKLAGVKPGDNVFCTDMTFAASANPVAYEKANPIFIDTEYDTWNMDPAALERAFELYPDTKVVIVVNLYGTPAKFDEIRAIANKHGAIIIEDAAESLGATYKGVQTGNFGKYSAISFNGNKIITGSSGGMLLADNSTDAMRARKWSTQSRENASWYQHEEIGYNYRMSNIVAGIVRGQLPYLEEHIARKKAIHERYKQGFKDLPLTLNPYDPDICEPNFWLSCILIDKAAMCEQVRSNNDVRYISEKGKTCPSEILDILAGYNVESRPIWKPMHMQPIYANNAFVSAADGTDVGCDIFERGLCLPSDIKMTAEQQDKIIEIIKGCFE